MQPQVSVIVPCRNEIRYIGAFLESVAAFECPSGAVEVADCRRHQLRWYARIAGRLRSGPDWLRVIPNPKRIVSSGLNTAIREARSLGIDSFSGFASNRRPNTKPEKCTFPLASAVCYANG